MHDSGLNGAERHWQPLFIFKLLIFLVFTLIAAALLHGDRRDDFPDRFPAPPRATVVTATALPLRWEAPPGWRLTGSWTLTSPDPRFAGLSALRLLPDRRLLALTDSAVLVAFPRPDEGKRAVLRDLPDGPGYPTFRRFRDSEAMLMHGGQLLVAFENRHSLWFYGRGAPVQVGLPGEGWKRNAGVEAMVMLRDGLLLLPEESDQALLLGPTGDRQWLTLQGRGGGIADAAALPDGRVMVAVREITWRGIRNRLALLGRSRDGLHLRTVATLPLGPVDNVEGLAAEPLPGGRIRLWAVTDNDGWRRTILLRLELDTPKAPAGAEASLP